MAVLLQDILDSDRNAIYIQWFWILDSIGSKTFALMISKARRAY